MDLLIMIIVIHTHCTSNPWQPASKLIHTCCKYVPQQWEKGPRVHVYCIHEFVAASVHFHLAGCIWFLLLETLCGIFHGSFDVHQKAWTGVPQFVPLSIDDKMLIIGIQFNKQDVILIDDWFPCMHAWTDKITLLVSCLNTLNGVNTEVIYPTVDSNMTCVVIKAC